MLIYFFLCSVKKWTNILEKYIKYEYRCKNYLEFMNTTLQRSKNGFKTSVYHKPTFIGVCSNFNSFIYDQYKIGRRGGSRTVTTSKMQRFPIIVNGFQSLTIITKCSILDVAAVLDPPLGLIFTLSFRNKSFKENFKKECVSHQTG